MTSSQEWCESYLSFPPPYKSVPKPVMSSSNSPNVQINSAVVRIPSLASIYQAKKSGDNSVEGLKQKFQSGIEHKIQHNSVNSRKMRDQHNMVMDELVPRNTGREAGVGLW